jgi:hypothetical protein
MVLHKNGPEPIFSRAPSSSALGALLWLGRSWRPNTLTMRRSYVRLSSFCSSWTSARPTAIAARMREDHGRGVEQPSPCSSCSRIWEGITEYIRVARAHEPTPKVMVGAATARFNRNGSDPGNTRGALTDFEFFAVGLCGVLPPDRHRSTTAQSIKPSRATMRARASPTPSWVSIGVSHRDHIVPSFARRSCPAAKAEGSGSRTTRKRS